MFFSRSPMVDVLAVPDFGRRQAIEMLMWAGVVVPEPELRQRLFQHLEIWYHPVIELLFQGEKEPLDPAVHPWAMQIGGLMPDAEGAQSEAKEGGREDALVIGTDDLRRAMFLEDIEQHAKNGNSGFCFQGFEYEVGARAVIDRAQNHVDMAALIHLAS